MVPSKNLPLLLRLGYIGYNRGLPNPENGAYGDFQPIFNSDGTLRTSFCNQFVQYVCNGMGYTNFQGMDANQMFAYMSDPANGWIAISDEAVVQAHANDGVIVLAAHATLGSHGHVNLILPGILEQSGSFNKRVPACANIGKDVFYGKKISFAFTPQEAPTYFALAGMIS